MDNFFEKVKSMMGENEPLEEKPQTATYANTVFKLPIEYLESKRELSTVVSSDLELVNTLDSSIPSMYACTFCPKTSFALQVMPSFQKYYTTDISFLLDTQQVIEQIDSCSNTTSYEVPCEKIEKQWACVKHDPKFMETYGYLEWDMLKEYNKNSVVLQSLTLANMLSPIMSFLIPFLFLLFPFIILKIQGIPISFGMYFQILKEIAKNHFIGKALSTFESFSFQKLIYLIGILALYGLQMYQNTIQCIRFYRNTQKINDELCEWKIFRQHSTQQIETFLNKTKHLHSYKPFHQELRKHLKVLRDIEYMLEPVQLFSCSITKTTEVGYLLKCYYELHSNEEFEETLVFCMGFDGYLQLLKGVKTQMDNGLINKATYTEDNFVIAEPETDVSGEDVIFSNCNITEQYYPPHKDELKCVKNNAVLDIYGVITGPNASGKTTYLKTTAINVILSQQIGVGFYSECMLYPYDYIHSYLNIPDTSGRDSLFQAESRRCKNILETIKNNSSERHFCIFDELYSGTNPKEATKSAYAFLEYLRQYNNVDLFLTTHYVSICDQWEKMSDEKRAIQNYKMKVVEKEGKNIPMYTIEKGISRIEGALGILQDMDYPKEMLTMIEGDDIVTV